MELLPLAERVVGENDRDREDRTTFGLYRGGVHSTAFKTLLLLLNRNWRTASTSRDVLERTAAIKDLVYLRGKLMESCVSRGGVESLREPTASASEPDTSVSLEAAIVRVYELTVGRTPGPDEIEIWKGNLANGTQFHEFFLGRLGSAEAQRHAAARELVEDRSDAVFVQWAFELLFGRGSTAREIEHWVSRIRSGAMGRIDVLGALFGDALRQREAESGGIVHDGLSFNVLGTRRFVTLEDWQRRARELEREPPAGPDTRYRHRFHIKSAPHVMVSAITSLYKGGDFIEQFMDNITSQSVFDNYCELIIVDADSPDNEAETIKRYLGRHEGIRYIRINYRIGIYDAWNVGVKAAQGEYLTNANLDDLRRRDSFELQAAVLDNLPFVDVTYQDFYYSFDPHLPFEEIARFGYESDLPILTPYNMLEYNSPHNAPMWRKRLHDELGYFNTYYRSAGDYEFWLRCLAAGKCFYKLNDPHVVYYQNPKGLSTRPDSRGVVEAREILRTYARPLISGNLSMPMEEFLRDRLPGVPAALAWGRRDRYALVQQGLRNAARQIKYTTTSGGAQ